MNARAELARALADLGRFDDATAAIEEAIRIAESRRHATTLLTARTDLGHVLISRGDWSAALGRQRGEPRARQQHLATALAMFRELGMLFWSERSEAEARVR